MKVYLKYAFLLVFILMTVSIFAQDDPPSPPDGGGGSGGVNDVPINFLIYPFLVIGTYLGYVFRNRL